jgi:K+/H+ antiporter YhaU regulatory subunit KhtT
MVTEGTMPIYAQIALDVAVRIARGELKEGAKITGRSTLAGEYKVSPETIRRALFLLEDTGIIHIQQGSGVVIKSREKASAYAEKQKSAKTVLDLKNEIIRMNKEKNKLEREIYEKIERIIDYSERLRNLNPIYPMEFEIPDESPLIGKLSKDVAFWQMTEGTIVGIRRNGRIQISPGPYASFEKGDILLVVGDADCYNKVKDFLRYGMGKTSEDSGI